MGKYECIDLSKKLKSDFFIKYIKHSVEYYEILNRVTALNYNDDIEFWIKRTNYSLFVQLSNFDTSTGKYNVIRYILFVCLSLFEEDKNIYLPDLDYPIILIRDDCEKRTFRTFKIYGRVATYREVFNNFSIENFSCYGYFLELVEDIKYSNFVDLANNLNSLSKSHYLNLFLNSSINYFSSGVYINNNNKSTELDIIKDNNISVNTFNLRISRWFKDVLLDTNLFECLDGIESKVNKCHLSIIGDCISTFDKYEADCVKIINKLKSFTHFKTFNVTFIPPARYTKEQLQMLKEKFISVSTELLSIDIYIE